MNFDDLPNDWQQWIISLKHNSSTIQNDINDALKDAEDLKDLQDRASCALEALQSEVMAVEDELFKLGAIEPICIACMDGVMKEDCEHIVKRIVGDCQGNIRKREQDE